MPEKELKLVLKVDDQGTIVLDKFTSQIKKAGESVSSMDRALGVIKWSALTNIAQQAINAGTQIFNFARSIASAGNDIQRMSRVFNMTTEEFQKWSYVTKMADVDIEGFGQGFKFLTRSMSEALQGSGDAAKAFSLLGINLKDATGRTKDQQTVMMEVIGTLEKYADGVNRDALMLAIFGRSWMSIKPLVDQGTKAIEENKEKAERLNIVLGIDLIKALSESEDSFKKWTVVWQASKLTFWTPMVQTFTDLLEAILKIKVALDSPPSVDKFKARLQELQEIAGQKGLAPFQKEMVENQIKTLQERIGEQYPEAPTQIKEWVAGWTPKKKPEAAGLIDEEKRIKELLDANKDLRDSLSKQALEDERMAWAELGNEMAGTGETFDQMLARQKALKEVLESSVPIYETVKEDWGAIGNELVATAEAYGITVDELLRIRDVLDSGIKDNAHFVDSLKTISTTWNDFGRTIADNFNTMFVDTLTGGFKNVADVFKKFCNSLLNSFISAIGKMMIEWALFETTTTGGETKKSFLGGGSGILKGIGTIAGLFSGTGGGPELLGQFQHGGIVTRPTFSMIGEAGPEAVIPLKGGKIPIEGGKKGDTYITYIEATDVDSFSRKYGPVIEGIYFKGKRFNKVAMR